MITTRCFRRRILWLLLLALNPTRLLADLIYNITEFSVPGCSSTDPRDINDSGQIVGTCDDSAGNSSGFLFSGGVFSTINYPGADDTVPNGISNTGIISGYYLVGGNSPGFIYENGSFTTVLYPGKSSTAVWKANDADLFVGTYSSSPGFSSFTSDGVNFQTVSFPGAFDTHALGINNAGQVAGYYETGAVAAGFIFTGGQYMSLSLPGQVIYAVDINNNGEVVGQIRSGGGPHNFLWRDGNFTPLDLGAGAYSEGMNDFGQIVGFVYGSTGGFVATPVPEPVYLLLFASGLVAILAPRLVSGKGGHR